jgi:hypothetical protein
MSGLFGPTAQAGADGAGDSLRRDAALNFNLQTHLELANIRDFHAIGRELASISLTGHRNAIVGARRAEMVPSVSPAIVLRTLQANRVGLWQVQAARQSITAPRRGTIAPSQPFPRTSARLVSSASQRSPSPPLVQRPSKRHQSGCGCHGGKKKAYIALGSNLGDRVAEIERACNEMDRRGIQVTRTSSLWETEPMYVLDQDRFLNGACEVRVRQ